MCNLSSKYYKMFKAKSAAEGRKRVSMNNVFFAFKQDTQSQSVEVVGAKAVCVSMIGNDLLNATPQQRSWYPPIAEVFP